MADDLITDLRIAAAIGGPNARKLYLAAADEIERCHARLEIDHEFVVKGDDLVRRAVPYHLRREQPDAVECRDATIQFWEGE